MRQVVGLRIPKSWLHDIDDASLDSAEPDGGWYTRDLYDKPGDADVVYEDFYCQVAAVAISMGDKSSVTVIQDAHTRILPRAEST